MRPYNFYPQLDGIKEELFASGSRRVIVMHKEGRDARDVNLRGGVKAQETATFLSVKAVKIAEVTA